MGYIAGAQTDVILLLLGERKVVNEHRLVEGELYKPVWLGFVTSRIPTAAVAMELKEFGAFARSCSFGFDVPRLGLA
jgi:hypothetical protein